MISLSDTLLVTLLPFGVAAAILLLFRQSAWAAPLSVGAAFVAAFCGINGWHSVLIPRSATPWLGWAVIGFTTIAIFDALSNVPIVVRAAVGFISTAGVSAWLLRFEFNHEWTAPNGTAHVAVIGLIAAAILISLAPRSIDGTPSAAIAISLTVGAGGLCVMALADQSIGEPMGAAAVAGTVLAVAAVFGNSKGWFQRGIGSAMIVAIEILVLSVVVAVYVSDVPQLYAWLILAGPVVFGLSGLILPRSMRLWQRASIRLTIAVIPVAIAVGLAINKANHDNVAGDPYSDAGFICSPSSAPPVDPAPLTTRC